MTERLVTTPRESTTVDPETIAEIDSVEKNLDQETIDLLTEARERVTRLMEELGHEPTENPTEVLPVVDSPPTSPEVPVTSPASIDEESLSQDEIYETYANNIAYTAEKERLIDPRSRLRKIGDSALRLNERLGKSTPAKMLARWGIIPPIGTRHTQRGFNFSAWAARKYVKAQAARKSREARINAGFLSVEDQAHLDAMDETQPVPSPEKVAQDTAYETYQENLDTTAERERQEKEAQDSAFETYQDNIDTTAKREQQESAYETYADNIDTTTKRETQENAYESYEANIEATAERERSEAHSRAERASADRSERHERHPIKERAANVKERLGRLRSRIGSSAMKLLGRAKAGLQSAAGAFRRSS